jgi:superfamily II DNA/RNA helicase
MDYLEYDPVRNGNGMIDYWGTEDVKIGMALDLICSKPNKKFLVFVHSKKTGFRILKYLNQEGILSDFHSADHGLSKRKDIEDRFRDRRALVSASTTA